MANLDADERKIALRHAGDVLVQLTIAAGAEDSGNFPLAARADAYAVDALESLATALGYRLVPHSLRGALADSVNLGEAMRAELEDRKPSVVVIDTLGSHLGRTA